MRHFLNDIEITPRNIQDIGIVTNFESEQNELEINVGSIVLPREAYGIVQQHVATKGFFEGIPYRMESESGVSLEYYVDLTDSPVFRSYETEVSVKKRLGKGSFYSQAAGTSFESLAAKGVNFESFDIPYIIVKDNAAELAVTLAISLYVMGKELIEQTKQLVIAITDLIGSVTPNVGLGVTFDIGDIIGLVLKVVAQLALVVALLAAVIKLGQQLLELIFPKIRYFKGSKVKTLIAKGCASIGYGFESTLLDSLSGLTILPKPLKKQEKSWFNFLQNDLNLAFNKGYPTAGDTTPNLLDLIQAVEAQFNARTRVVNGVVRLERRDYWQNITQNQIIPSLVLQDVRQDEYSVNVEDAWKRYYIHYQPDISDLHTYDDFEGNEAEYSAEPLNVSSSDLITLKGRVEVNIPFALGSRKSQLNWIENLAKGLFQVIDNVASFFGGNSSLSAKIENRIGVLQISQQYFSTTKMMYTIGGKQPANYLNFIRASQLWNNYHYINQIQLNGSRSRENVRCRMSMDDFVSLIDNNYAEIFGTSIVAELTKVEYIEDSGQVNATISYKEPYDYASGKVQTIPINV